MNKILFIGPYRDGTGYSQAALDNIVFLDSVGFDVACRPVRMSDPKVNDVSKINHLENKDLKNIDSIIQLNLPHAFERKSGVKNIGCFYWETTDFKSSIWGECCNSMDEIWVTNIQQKQACINSRVNVPIKIINHPYDINKKIDTTEKLDIPLLKDRCVFYFIGEMNKRKNFAALIRGFYSAFIEKENVILVIKTNIPNNNSQQTMAIMNKFIQDIKTSTHIHKDQDKYPKILVITEHLSEKQINQLHSSCDIFVSPSHGEAVCLPAMDAMFHGNPLIVSNWGNFPELCYYQADKYWEPQKELFKYPGEIDCGWLIDGRLTYCFGMINGFNDIYTGSEKWFDVDICNFVHKLQMAYNEWSNGSISIRKENAKKRLQEFSYEKIRGAIA
jgi:glycosyltransferase involved in cell wall biosynthesis